MVIDWLLGPREREKRLETSQVLEGVGGRGGQDLKFSFGPTECEESLRRLRVDVKKAAGFVPQIKD